MPFRIIGYDGIEYIEQIKKKVLPVLTFVFYYGKERWNTHKSILENVEEDFELRNQIVDYPIRIIEISYLEREVIDQFTSDFYFIADFFEQQRRIGTYIPSQRTLKHPKETITLLSLLAKDHRIVKLFEKKEVDTMCEIFDQFIEKGKLIGIEQERWIRIRKITINLMKKLNYSIQEALSFQDIPENEWNDIINRLEKELN